MIPLQTPSFKIGRGETCNLRPNSEEVSREHAEFSVTADTVAVRDLGSRNGTLVNGKRLTEPCKLKDSDLIQIGPLTFAISIQGAPVPVAGQGAPVKAPAKPKSPDDISHDDIESWLVSDGSERAPRTSVGNLWRRYSDDEGVQGEAAEPATSPFRWSTTNPRPGTRSRRFRTKTRKTTSRRIRIGRADRREQSVPRRQEEARGGGQEACRKGFERRRLRHPEAADGTETASLGSLARRV